jgi:hypothetical protein
VEQHGRCPTVQDEVLRSDFLVPVGESRDDWVAHWARSAAGYSAKAAHSMAQGPVYLAARYLWRGARWKAEQDSSDFQGMTADSWAAHSPDDCPMAQWPVYLAGRYLSRAARWKAEQDSTDFRGMRGDSSAAHPPGDCSMARRPRVVLAD